MLSACSGAIIAFDLDDTLLLNDYTSPGDWSLHASQSVGAFHTKKLSKNWPKTLWEYLHGRHTTVCSSTAHPFLQLPPVRVMLRPGMLGCLRGLQSLGATLVLVTASARRRVDYIWQRWPELAGVFQQGRINLRVCAEDLAPSAVNNGHQTALWNEAKALHHAYPRCLSAKTRWRVSSVLCIAPYDLLVDDSTQVAELFSQHGLDKHLLSIQRESQSKGYALTIIESLLSRLAEDLQSVSPLPTKPEYDRFVPKDYTPPVLDDPWYMPLLHIRDRP